MPKNCKCPPISAYTNAHPLSGWRDTSQAGETRRRKELKKRVRFAQIDEQFPWRTMKRTRRRQGGAIGELDEQMVSKLPSDLRKLVRTYLGEPQDVTRYKKRQMLQHLASEFVAFNPNQLPDALRSPHAVLAFLRRLRVSWAEPATRTAAQREEALERSEKGYEGRTKQKPLTTSNGPTELERYGWKQRKPFRSMGAHEDARDQSEKAYHQRKQAASKKRKRAEDDEDEQRGGGWEDEMAKAVERDRLAQQDAAEAARIKAAAARASRASLSKKKR